MLGDSLVGRELVAPGQLRRIIETARGRGVRLARRAAGMVREGVDSPMETRARMLFVLAGLPEPEVNIELRDSWGHVVRRIDLGYRELKLGLEYEGRQRAESQRQWENDVTRRQELETAGWRIVSLLAKDIHRTPDRTVDLARAALMARGLRVGPLSDEWRRYFPILANPY